MLYRSNKILEHILKSNENVYKDIFRESELKEISKTHFDSLLSHKLLTEKYIDPTTITFSKNGSAYRVYEEDSGYIGHRIRGEGEPKIKLTKKDVTFYEFSFESFCRLIKDCNYFSGKYLEATKRVHFVGRTEKNNDVICLCIGLFDSDRTAKQELMALSSNFSQYQYFIVLSPSFELNEELNGRFYDKGIYYRTFELGCDNSWKVDLSIIKIKNSKPLAFSVPSLTKTEKNKYANDYPRKDIIKFYDTSKGFFVQVNGNEVKLTRIQYCMLAFFADMQKKSTNGGKVKVEDVLKIGIARDAQHFYRISGELNNLLKPIEDCSEKVIDKVEGEPKVFRITTMPNRVQQPHTQWLKGKYPPLIKKIIEEREKRQKK